MKDNKAIIAKNPLSENIAKILDYKEGMLESELRKKARIISDKIKDKFGKTVNFETIVSWVLSSSEDPVRARAFIGFDRISMFAEIAGINYWELFIPQNYININNFSQKRKDTFEMMQQLDEKFLNDVQRVVIGHIREEAIRTSKLFNKFSKIVDKQKEDDNQ